MDMSTQRRTLTGLSAMLLAGSLGAGYWAVADLDQLPAVSADRIARPIKLPDAVAGSAVAGGQDSALRSLRAPLYDPPPAPPRPEPKVTTAPSPRPTPKRSEPKLGLTLVGTIMDSRQSVAIVADDQGGVDVKGIGQTLDLKPDGVTIQAIQSQQITLRYQGKESVVHLDRSAAKATPLLGRPGGKGPLLRKRDR